MQRIVSAYFDMAEMQAMRKIRHDHGRLGKRLSGFLQLWAARFFMMRAG